MLYTLMKYQLSPIQRLLQSYFIFKIALRHKLIKLHKFKSLMEEVIFDRKSCNFLLKYLLGKKNYDDVSPM